jgi:hypothetical protein
MTCATCATELDPNAVVCVHCGAVVAQTPFSVPPNKGAPLVPAETEPALFSATLLDGDKHLEGLSGWLILVGLGLVISPFVILGGVVVTNVPLLMNAKFQPFLESHPALDGLILFEIASNLCFAAVNCVLLYLFFKKKRSFPTYMILYMAFHVLILFGDTAAAHMNLPSTRLSIQTTTSIVRAATSAAIWIPYFLLSRRVKVTFVH